MLSNMTVSFKYGDATGNFSNANVIFGNIPCRPISATATGIFTNDSIQRIDADITDISDLSGITKGETLEITLNYVAFTAKMTFEVSEVATSRIRVNDEWQSVTILSLTIDPTVAVEFAKAE